LYGELIKVAPPFDVGTPLQDDDVEMGSKGTDIEEDVVNNLQGKLLYMVIENLEIILRGGTQAAHHCLI
jgi:hypothetical protein